MAGFPHRRAFDIRHDWGDLKTTEILKDANISVMAISAFTTDAFLVREDDLQPALRALQAGGFSVSYDRGMEP